MSDDDWILIRPSLVRVRAEFLRQADTAGDGQFERGVRYAMLLAADIVREEMKALRLLHEDQCPRCYKPFTYKDRSR